MSLPWALVRLEGSPLVACPPRQALVVVRQEALAALQAEALQALRELERRVQRLVWRRQKSERCRLAVVLNRCRVRRTRSRPLVWVPPVRVVRQAVASRRYPEQCRLRPRVPSLLVSRSPPRVCRLRHLDRTGRANRE